MTTRLLKIRGVVQGIGFRPFVARLAEQMGVVGEVRNSGGVVEITACGEPALLDRFTRALREQAPFGAEIYDIESTEGPERNFSGFSIISSGFSPLEAPVLPVDLPTCPDCEREMADPNDRRYRYPFISCVACGPRYSVIESLPYDRPRTTMRDYEMCPECLAEYTGRGRRRHAQTISCHSCGPQLLLRCAQGELSGEAALQQAICLLRQGGVLAVKGIGGYHLACSPFDTAAVQRLRQIKGREEKPFATMFPSLSSLREHCRCSGEEAALLQSVARPIVLLERLAQSKICRAVYRQSRCLGAFLPYTPLQRLLLEACGPLVLTSANRSGEPILFTEEQIEPMARELDGVLYNTRRIVVPLDDSVAQYAGGAARLIRRSRGYVPAAIALPSTVEQTIFAAGGDLKAVFGIYHHGLVYLSQYFGDLENEAVFQSYQENRAHLQRLFGLTPQLAAADLNPAYHATRLAAGTGLPLDFWQHHHAHIASVMAEHRLSSAIGVAFDGTGLGEDGAVWGGEFLVCTGSRMQRVGQLAYLPVCGYDNAAKDASLYALHLLLASGEDARAGQDARTPLLQAALKAGVNTLPCSSMGRLFDGVAALLSLGSYNHYEGECAVLLEQAAWRARAANTEPTALELPLVWESGRLQADVRALCRSICRHLSGGASPEALALGFHLAVADATHRACRALREQSGISVVALSGGVFVNRLLLEETQRLLRQDGFLVYSNERVPAGDGGLALGQLYLTVKKREEESACV